jgi:hypothetical protein
MKFVLRYKNWSLQTSVFICTLLNDAVSSLHYIVSNDRVVNEKWIGKDLEESCRGLI